MGRKRKENQEKACGGEGMNVTSIAWKGYIF